MPFLRHASDDTENTDNTNTKEYACLARQKILPIIRKLSRIALK